MIQTNKHGKLVEPATRVELVTEIHRLRTSIREVASYLRGIDKEVYANLMEIILDRGSDV